VELSEGGPPPSITRRKDLMAKRENIRCKACRKLLSFGERRRTHARMTALGVSRPDLEIIVPRCVDCAGKWLAEHSGLPHAMIARCPLPVYVLHVKDEGWPELFGLLTSNWVCVRVAPRLLLVVTDQEIPDMVPVSDPVLKRSAAAMVEGAVLARPPGTETRYLASPGWGGNP
jgi:hypothetical protein